MQTMKKTGRIGLLFFLLAIPIQSAIQSKKMALAQVLETGGFHGAEVKARTGEQWLGLYATKNSSALILSRLTVKREYDEIVDVGTNQKTGKAVSVNRPTKPIFLVKGATMLHAGLVTTVYKAEQGRAKALGNGAAMDLKLGGRSYRLQVVSKDSTSSSDEGVLSADAKMILTSDQTTQVLYSLVGKSANDPNWFLLWAGDLDGDGKLDLYMNLGYHYNMSQHKLFLSSQARKGQLVREVAEFVTTGC